MCLVAAYDICIMYHPAVIVSTTNVLLISEYLCLAHEPCSETRK